MIGWLKRWFSSGDTEPAPVPADVEPLFAARGEPPDLRHRAAPVTWLPGETPPMTTLAEIGLDAVELCPARLQPAPASMIFSNHSVTAENFARHMRDRVYTARNAAVDAIRLVRLPPETVVFGGDHFLVVCGNSFLAEQFPPYAGTAFEAIDRLTPLELPVVEVAEEVLLIARFGIGTWGHWLGELLPKLLLAERAFPGRFTYLLPTCILDAEPQAAIWSSIRQSLDACGIGRERVFAASAEVNYRFAALHAVTPVWSDHVMHEDASDAVRQACAWIPSGDIHKLAVVRRPGALRSMENREAIDAVLEARGFALVQTGALSFAEQVAIFKGASTVFATLGSDLTNLLFAPRGVRVITAAPDAFGDRFFYALVLDRAGRMADLRGPIVRREGVEHLSSFTLDPAALISALHVMAA